MASILSRPQCVKHDLQNAYAPHSNVNSSVPGWSGYDFKNFDKIAIFNFALLINIFRSFW